MFIKSMCVLGQIKSVFSEQWEYLNASVANFTTKASLRLLKLKAPWYSL